MTNQTQQDAAEVKEGAAGVAEWSFDNPSRTIEQFAEGFHLEALGFEPIKYGESGPPVPQVSIRIAKVMMYCSQRGDQRGRNLAADAQRHLLSGGRPFEQYLIAREIWNDLYPMLSDGVDQPVLDIAVEDISRAAIWQGCFSPYFGSQNGDVSLRIKKALSDRFRKVAVDLHKNAEERAQRRGDLPLDVVIPVMDKIIFCLETARRYANGADAKRIEDNLSFAVNERDQYLKMAQASGKTITRWAPRTGEATPSKAPRKTRKASRSVPQSVYKPTEKAIPPAPAPPAVPKPVKVSGGSVAAPRSTKTKRHTKAAQTLGISERSRTKTALMAFFLGGFGVHRFYVGKTKSGIGMLVLTLMGWFLAGIGPWCMLPLSAVSIWVLCDLVAVLIGRTKDGKNKFIKRW